MDSNLERCGSRTLHALASEFGGHGEFKYQIEFTALLLATQKRKLEGNRMRQHLVEKAAACSVEQL